jgi:hypothetical protein
VSIVKELVRYQADGNSGGSFILQPISPVGLRRVSGNLKPNVDYLIPGGYGVRRYGSSLVIVPMRLDLNWICGVDDRRRLFGKYTQATDGEGHVYKVSSLVVSLDGATAWPIHEQGHGGQQRMSSIYSPEVLEPTPGA